MGASVGRRFALLPMAFLQLFTAIAALVLAVVTVTGLSLVVIAWGLPILALTTRLTKPLAGGERRLAGFVLRRRIASPYLPHVSDKMTGRLRETVADPARRRDVYWLCIHGTVGLGLAVCALAEAFLDLTILWLLPPGMCQSILCNISAFFLDETEPVRLAHRVREVEESRTEVVTDQADEVRRIERDLHDGAQARLVALGLSLSMAEALLETDPEQARALLAEARQTGTAALSDIRGVVRGIRPPLLADRGLVDAVRALALQMPGEVTVEADALAGLPTALESAAYFAVAEALTNVMKHAHATRVQVTLHQRDGALHLGVLDNGVGGANARGGTGLSGMERRLGAFDGTVSVSSPVGGPTMVHMVLPCASSSPRTSRSSATG